MWTPYNIAISPIAFLIRVPIMCLAFTLQWLGERLEEVGRCVPGLTTPLRRQRRG